MRLLGSDFGFGLVGVRENPGVKRNTMPERIGAGARCSGGVALCVSLVTRVRAFVFTYSERSRDA